MNGEQNIDGKALLSWVTWTCFKFLGRSDFKANVTICQGNVAQIALFHLLPDLLPCLCLLERKKREILFETCNWSVKFPAVINFKIHFDFSVLKAKSSPGWQEEFMFDGLEGIASLRSLGLRLCDDICEIHSSHNDVIIFEKYNHYKPKKCV